MATKISGAELKPGMTIKAGGRLYTLMTKDDEEDSRFSDLWEVQASNGTYSWMNTFADGEYELRSGPSRPRPRIVKVTLQPELSERVERARLAGETTADAIIRLITHCLDESLIWP